MDIRSKGSYPSGALSNFAPHPFVIDDVSCSSMEGFLQSLKFKNPEMQKEICKLVGIAAKKAGSKKNWRKSQVLWWKGKQYKRDSEDYKKLLNDAYMSLSKNESFKKALLSTGKATLTHSLGKNKEHETVLTTREFCGMLTHIRELLRSEQQ